jgi:hypothetical protein
MYQMKRFRIGIFLTVGALVAFGASGYAQEFPWQPSTPPVYTPSTIKPVEVPKVDAPTRVVPGHKSSSGYVAPYETDGPMPPPVAPGNVSKGWVPGHHDAKGAWVPGHPR